METGIAMAFAAQQGSKSLDIPLSMAGLHMMRKVCQQHPLQLHAVSTSTVHWPTARATVPATFVVIEMQLIHHRCWFSTMCPATGRFH